MESVSVSSRSTRFRQHICSSSSAGIISRALLILGLRPIKPAHMDCQRMKAVCNCTDAFLMWGDVWTVLACNLLWTVANLLIVPGRLRPWH
jgi:hypothetical protein